MTNPLFIEEKPLALADVKVLMEHIQKRDGELNPVSTRLQEYLDAFVTLDSSRREELRQKLAGLDLTRLKEEHMAKFIDFLPSTLNDLKIVLQAYPLSLPKKDQESIVNVVKEFT